MSGRRWLGWGLAGVFAAALACGGSGHPTRSVPPEPVQDGQGGGSGDVPVADDDGPGPGDDGPVAGVDTPPDTAEPPPDTTPPGPGPEVPPPPVEVDAGTPDAGSPDAGSEVPPPPVDADAGTPDADAGTPDAGTPPPTGPVVYPDAHGWTFYGQEQGAPREVYGVTEDEGGNLWVAGGEEGLFLLRPGATTFQRFTLDDGLRPYGYLKDGSAPVGPKYLKVIAVTGGPAGTVFVGQYASVAYGDYMTGANHVLPTAGLARAYSGLSVLDFYRWTTYQRVTRDAAARLADDVGLLADSEGLFAHADAARGWRKS